MSPNPTKSLSEMRLFVNPATKKKVRCEREDVIKKLKDRGYVQVDPEKVRAEEEKRRKATEQREEEHAEILRANAAEVRKVMAEKRALEAEQAKQAPTRKLRPQPKALGNPEE